MPADREAKKPPSRPLFYGRSERVRTSGPCLPKKMGRGAESIKQGDSALVWAPPPPRKSGVFLGRSQKRIAPSATDANCWGSCSPGGGGPRNQRRSNAWFFRSPHPVRVAPHREVWCPGKFTQIGGIAEGVVITRSDHVFSVELHPVVGFARTNDVRLVRTCEERATHRNHRALTPGERAFGALAVGDSAVDDDGLVGGVR